MIKIMIEAANLEEVQWPARCPSCCTDVTLDFTGKSVITVRKAFMASFTKTQKKITLSLCDRCYKRLLNYTNIERVGKGVTAVALIFLQKHLMYLGVSGLGFIVMMIGSKLKTEAAGVECLCKSRGTWTFSFRNNEFADQFAELNEPRIVKRSLIPEEEEMLDEDY